MYFLPSQSSSSYVVLSNPLLRCHSTVLIASRFLWVLQECHQSVANLWNAFRQKLSESLRRWIFQQNWMVGHKRTFSINLKMNYTYLRSIQESGMLSRHVSLCPIRSGNTFACSCLSKVLGNEYYLGYLFWHWAYSWENTCWYPLLLNGWALRKLVHSQPFTSLADAAGYLVLHTKTCILIPLTGHKAHVRWLLSCPREGDPSKPLPHIKRTSNLYP